MSSFSFFWPLPHYDADKPTLVAVAVDANGNNVAYYKDSKGNLQSATFDFTTPKPPFNPGPGEEL